MSTRSEMPKLLTPAEVAQAFNVNPKTVTRWAVEGRLSSVFTPGGHRRYYLDQVREMLGVTKNPNPHPSQFRRRSR